MLYTDYYEFAEKVGIVDADGLEKLGFKNDNDNRICTSRLQELKEFVSKLNTQSIQFIKGAESKRYHIATDLDASDLEEYDDDDERLSVATCIANEIHFVNRMDYFLCDGDADSKLYLEEVEEV